jgi:hypothetical protein
VIANVQHWTEGSFTIIMVSSNKEGKENSSSTNGFEYKQPGLYTLVGWNVIA